MNTFIKLALGATAVVAAAVVVKKISVHCAVEQVRKDPILMKSLTKVMDTKIADEKAQAAKYQKKEWLSFNEQYASIEKSLPFDSAFDNGTGYFKNELLVLGTETLAPGEYRIYDSVSDRRLILEVSGDLPAVLLFERYRNGGNGTICYQTEIGKCGEYVLADN